jgi:sortase (surface protein transpeptidase)
MGPSPTPSGGSATATDAAPRATTATTSLPTSVTTASPTVAGTLPSTRPADLSAIAGTTGLGAFPLPTRLRIPKIHVDAPVETVGLETSGAMQKPSAPDVVAWYGYGPTPGSAGAAVLAGHVDSVHGPAVFWSLQDLHAGDVVEVELLGSHVFRFVVDSSSLYVPEAAPIDLIFSPTGPPRLNLITCGGVFDRSRHAYDHRLVVFAKPALSARQEAPRWFA